MLEKRWGDGFAFCGVHCSLYDAAFKVRLWPTLSNGIINKVVVAARNGSLRYPGRWHMEQHLLGTLYLLTDDDRPLDDMERYTRAAEIASWLCPGERRQLIFDACPRRFYVAEIEREMTMTTDQWPSGAISLDFTLQPFAYSTEKQSVTIARNANGSLSLSGTQPAPMECVVTAAATLTWVQLTLPDAIFRLQGFSIASGKVISVTCDVNNNELLDVKVDGLSGMQYLTADSAAPLLIKPGMRTIAFTANANCSATVSARPRWL